jgi:ABC-type amino acid transport substrate-binding protein
MRMRYKLMHGVVNAPKRGEKPSSYPRTGAHLCVTCMKLGPTSIGEQWVMPLQFVTEVLGCTLGKVQACTLRVVGCCSKGTDMNAGLKRSLAGLAWLVAIGAPMANAQTPVLDKLRGGAPFVIAHRESSVPFSYYDDNKQPIGYAVELCQRLAEVVRKELKLKDMKIEYKMVTGATRIPTIESGEAMLECGSTTNNAERRQKVAFTVPHFITGARILVSSSSKAETLEEMQGKRMVSTKGTTPLKALESANKERLFRMTILEAPDHGKAIEMVEKNEADGFVMDDVLLYGLAAGRPNPKAFRVIGKFMTTEPLAIMLPKNDASFKRIIDAEMKRLVTSREIYAVYDKWFLKPIPPKGTTLNLPVSYLLRDFWKMPTDLVPF